MDSHQTKRNYVKRKRSINECTKQIFGALKVIHSSTGRRTSEQELNEMATQYAKSIEASCWSRKAKYSDEEFQAITREKTNELCNTLYRSSGVMKEGGNFQYQDVPYPRPVEIQPAVNRLSQSHSYLYDIGSSIPIPKKNLQAPMTRTPDPLLSYPTQRFGPFAENRFQPPLPMHGTHIIPFNPIVDAQNPNHPAGIPAYHPNQLEEDFRVLWKVNEEKPPIKDPRKGNIFI